MQRPPDTFATRVLVRFIRWSERMPPSRRLLVIAVMLVATLVVDYVTGPKVSMNLFYVMVSCLGGWWFGQRGGAGLALVNTACITFASAMNGEYVSLDDGVFAWNLAVRLSSHLFYVWIASGLRQTLENERWLAGHDALTGALNVRAFHACTGDVLAMARQRGERVLLGYLDLDGFKGVNDRFGHAAGDSVLHDFAVAAHAAVRREDLFARMGGDEFAVMAAVPTAMQGEALAELLHARLTAVLAATGYEVTCSMGAVILDPRHAGQAAPALARADALMYEVKGNGRNALRIAHLHAAGSGPQQVAAAA